VGRFRLLDVALLVFWARGRYTLISAIVASQFMPIFPSEKIRWFITEVYPFLNDHDLFKRLHVKLRFGVWRPGTLRGIYRLS